MLLFGVMKASLSFPMTPSHTVHKASDDCSGILGGEQEASGLHAAGQGLAWFCAQGPIFTWLVGTLFGGPSKILSNLNSTKTAFHTDVMMWDLQWAWLLTAAALFLLSSHLPALFSKNLELSKNISATMRFHLPALFSKNLELYKKFSATMILVSQQTVNI